MANAKNRIVFGDKGQWAVVRPSGKLKRKADLIYAAALNEAIKAGCLLRQKLDQYMKDQKLWTEEHEKQFDELRTRLNENEMKLRKGGVKLSEGKAIALKIADDRAALRFLLATRSSLDSATAEGQADNVRLNFLLANCIVDDHGKPYCNDQDDYEKKQEEGDPVLNEGMTHFLTLIYGLEDEKLPENEFLRQYKFVDEKGRFVNKKGQLTDRHGRTIREDGRYIDDEGRLVDVDGNLVTEEGLPVMETLPFLPDDEGGV